MPFKIVRNDITKMNTEAIVNTANENVAVGSGCDYAVYQAAGYDELLAYRRENIGAVKEGDVFITPGFALPAKYIIHAVSPRFADGSQGEEDLLRSCYQKSLALAAEKGIRSIAFPLISTGGFGYPKEEGMRIAVDEIHAFLLRSDMEIYLVVFDEKATEMGKSLRPDLEAYIDAHYVEEKDREEYGGEYMRPAMPKAEAEAAKAAPSGTAPSGPAPSGAAPASSKRRKNLRDLIRPGFRPSNEQRPAAGGGYSGNLGPNAAGAVPAGSAQVKPYKAEKQAFAEEISEKPVQDYDAAVEEMERKLKERLAHISDTFSEYLFFLIGQKGLKNSDVYKKAIVDRKVFSKIKNDKDYHPQKLTALCLCVGAQLNIDESKDLLARAGYALSPCDKTDIIFSFFIENKHYDMIDLDIYLEEQGLPCIIS